MRKTILKFLGITTVMLALTGCVIVINNGKPTDDEKTLMDLQSQASQKVTEINQKIQTGAYSVPQIQDLVKDAKKVVDDNLKKIDSLKLPDRTKAMADKTKEYLQAAEKTYDDFLQMSSQAVDQTTQEIQDLTKQLETVSKPLINMANQIEQMKNQFLDQLQQAAGSTQTIQK